MPLRKDGIETKKKILAVCVRLFLEQGYRETTISQIVEEAGVARGSFQNLFPTKDAVLMELLRAMFDGQFGVARRVADRGLPPVYAYAVETAIQITLTELNENLREIYIEAYTQSEASEYIFRQMSKELLEIFGSYLPGLTQEDFYALEIGSAGIMRGYMARACDEEFTLEKKLRCFLTMSLSAYKVSEEEIRAVLEFIGKLNIRELSEQVMQKLFQALAMRYEFSAQTLL